MGSGVECVRTAHGEGGVAELSLQLGPLAPAPRVGLAIAARRVPAALRRALPLRHAQVLAVHL